MNMLSNFDVEDIAKSMYAWVWNELVNTYQVPDDLADIVADGVEDLVRDELAQLGDRSDSSTLPTSADAR